MIRVFLFVASLTLLVSVDRAEAGLVIVSGDTNIINSLTGDMTGVYAGNQQFFTNILGGGSKVVVENGGNGNYGGDLQTFYNKIGVTDSNVSGPITAAALTGASTFIAIEPSASFSGAELSVLQTFLASGGNVFLLGDYIYTIQGISTGFIKQDANINTDLTGLGSSMQIVPDYIDPLYHTIGPSNIASNALTAGVTSFNYAATSQVSGGTTLFTTQTGSSPFVAVEQVGGSAVPEPSSLLMTAMVLLLGTAPLAWKRRSFWDA